MSMNSNELKKILQEAKEVEKTELEEKVLELDPNAVNAAKNGNGDDEIAPIVKDGEEIEVEEIENTDEETENKDSKTEDNKNESDVSEEENEEDINEEMIRYIAENFTKEQILDMINEFHIDLSDEDMLLLEGPVFDFFSRSAKKIWKGLKLAGITGLAMLMSHFGVNATKSIAGKVADTHTQNQITLNQDSYNTAKKNKEAIDSIISNPDQVIYKHQNAFDAAQKEFTDFVNSNQTMNQENIDKYKKLEDNLNIARNNLTNAQNEIENAKAEAPAAKEALDKAAAKLEKSKNPERAEKKKKAAAGISAAVAAMAQAPAVIGAYNLGKKITQDRTESTNMPSGNGTNVKESYSDLELMQWLDESDYEPTVENILILKEMLEKYKEETMMEEKDIKKPVLDKEPQEVKVELDNEDIYNKETEPVKAEDVEEVIVEGLETLREFSDYELMQWLDENDYEPTMENVSVLREMIEKPVLDKEPKEEKPELDNEDIYNAETEKKAEDVKEVIVESEEPVLDRAPKEEKPEIENKDVYDNEEEPVKAEDIKEVELNNGDITDKPAEDVKEVDIKESMTEIFRILKSLNESEKPVLDKEPKEEKPELDNEDIYNKETEPVKAEDVKEVIVESEEPVLDREPKEEAPKLDNEDIYNKETEEKAEDVEGVIVKEETQEDLNEGLFGLGVSEKDFEIRRLVVKYSNAHGRSYGSGEYYRFYPLFNDREVQSYTEKCASDKTIHEIKEKATELLKNAKANKNELKQLKEEFKKRVDEICAGSRPVPFGQAAADAEAKKAKDDALAQAKYDAQMKAYKNGNLTEEEAPEVGKPEEKEFKVEELACPKAEAEEREEANPEPKEIQESVRYASLKEACLLDEGYFRTDTYIRESAEEKQEKLVEQIALLLARENMDPLYEELLSLSIKADRLQEACVRKYRDAASTRADSII